MGKGVVNKGELIRKTVLTILDIRPSEIARELNMSPSFVSRLINGQRKHPLFDSWFANIITNLDQ